MPPYNYLITFEELEAKEWASNTVADIITDVLPVSFDSGFASLEVIYEEGQSQETENKERRLSLKRDRSPSAIMTDHSIITSHSAPPSPQSLSPKPSVSNRIRHSWQMDRTSVKQLLINTPDLFNTLSACSHKITNKEQKGIAIWKSTYATYIVEPPPSLKIKPKPITKRSIQLSKFNMAELLTTEETYLTHLMIIKKFYMNPLLQAATQKGSLVNLKDVEIIFAHIPQLISLSSALAEQLHQAIISSEEKKSVIDSQHEAPIGKIFCDFENYFGVYIAYAVNYSKSKKYLTKASSNIIYRQLVKDSIRKKETNKMLLDDYMIAPIQRVTRYCLLLKELQKHSDPTLPDYTYLDKAIKSLSALAVAMEHVL
ncbi:hypothetical protein G6F46_011321 [Rhizopus delemar]|nr:hypothetical protein G6F55_011795 [Rhizopus delemar]KAG1535525.1 hypothetical protein G6F51_011492 [Rhizopus arrhizus]KAG1488606.1 hypothetical protein G6F54_011985 [Rhizopus delemar]KAG1496910.1 hypothetical protein G6F53_012078 [Rhizopus delemar]KAG1550514.1 hypothetical protein G6F49_009269 [Rhizopus delemar]